MAYLMALVAGLLFGLGLLWSGMGDPAVVQGFLDPFGDWQPNLALVMVAALAVTSLGVLVAKRRRLTWLGQPLSVPKGGKMDGRLVVGGLLFGVGWGLVGICPGPAVLLFSRGVWQGAVFVVAMLAGMGLFHLMQKNQQKE